MADFPYRVPPMDHQVEALKRAYPKKAFALFHDPGCGKTFTTINLIAARYHKLKIDRALIICPTPIKVVWDDEIAKMMPENVAYSLFIMNPGCEKKFNKWVSEKSDDLKILVAGVESLSQGKAPALVARFARDKLCMTVVDESSSIKTPGAVRTKNVITLGDISEYRLILTGTPVTQGIQDLYSQFLFLNPAIIGCKSYFLFKNRYCILGGFENRNIIGYQNTPDLMEKLGKHIHTVKSEEVLDLPEKIYKRMVVPPTKEQKQAVKDLKDMMMAEVDGDLIVTKTILERMTRFAQICGGNFPYNNPDGEGYLTKPIPGKNPKIEALMADIAIMDHTKKAIIWCRFRPELEAVKLAILDAYGPHSFVEFHGGVDYEGRKKAINDFQADRTTRFFITNQATGGMGLTLTAAHTAYYISNSFSYEDRIQSEARIWRKGQIRSCLYIDIEVDLPYDALPRLAVSRKQDVATMVDEQLKHYSELVT